MAHFDIPEGNRAGSVTEFGGKVELIKSCQKAMDLIDEINPLMEELFHMLYLFDDCDTFYNSVVDFYVNGYEGEQELIKRAEKLKTEIE